MQNLKKNPGLLKFMFSKKATKLDKIFATNLTLCIKCQIDSEDFANFYGLLRKHELYPSRYFRKRNGIFLQKLF